MNASPWQPGADERPKDAAWRRPSPAGIEESGRATFPCELNLPAEGHSIPRIRLFTAADPALPAV